MRALDLDYLQPSRPPRARYALVAAAISFAVLQTLHYRDLHANVTTMTSALARHPEQAIQAPPRVVAAEELALARTLVARLTTPWDRLFGAMESAHTEDVALLSIEPDAEGRTVTVNGEARDYLAALTYMARLADQPALHRVHIVRHETLKGGGRRPLAFTISAAWKEAL